MCSKAWALAIGLTAHGLWLSHARNVGAALGSVGGLGWGLGLWTLNHSSSLVSTTQREYADWKRLRTGSPYHALGQGEGATTWTPPVQRMGLTEDRQLGHTGRNGPSRDEADVCNPPYRPLACAAARCSALHARRMPAASQVQAPLERLNQPHMGSEFTRASPHCVERTLAYMTLTLLILTYNDKRHVTAQS